MTAPLPPDPRVAALVQAYQEHVARVCSPPPDEPPLAWGERCRLLAGGPSLLVVDLDGDSLTVAYRDKLGAHEMPLARWCLRRVR